MSNLQHLSKQLLLAITIAGLLLVTMPQTQVRADNAAGWNIVAWENPLAVKASNKVTIYFPTQPDRSAGPTITCTLVPLANARAGGLVFRTGGRSVRFPAVINTEVFQVAKTYEVRAIRVGSYSLQCSQVVDRKTVVRASVQIEVVAAK